MIPRKINFGSGKDFRADYINIDYTDYWKPDIVLDVSRPLEPGAHFDTKRFGEITLTHDSFDEIIAIDVLEHVPDVIATVTNCLKLLRLGGVMNVLVPYDLSYGAWRDPTHVRAFNEHSWLYYTDWFWYVGWQTHRFVLRNLEFMMNPIGMQMQQAGHPNELILRTPRTVDSMKATLEKIELTPTDKEMLAKFKPPGERQRIVG